MKILVINCGSSSIKFKLYETDGEAELAGGLIERVGESESHTEIKVAGTKHERFDAIPDYESGIRQILELLTTCGDPPPIKDASEIDGVGHRVVHGAEKFNSSVVVTDELVAVLEECTPLAPLHNPANIAGIEATKKALPGKPQVGVFDTAFFQTMPPSAYLYAVPYAWYEEKRIRRYGFHGTSHRFVAGRAAEMLGNDKPNLISLHLGNGGSVTCIREGVAVDQTMGLTPLEGLVMGTRSGDIDPAIIFHLVREGMELDEVRQALEKKSGLEGISGVSRDMRDVEQAAADGHERAQLALDVYAHRARKYLGAFLAELGRCDGIIFTGGVGENGDAMRAKIASGLEALGIELDPERNAGRKKEACEISTDASRTKVFVIPTNEELMIARDTAMLIG